MPSFKNVLNEIGDASADAAKEELRRLLAEAKSDTSAFARDNAKRLEKWIVDLHTGELDQEEFNELIAAQRAAAEQFVNTRAIEGRARARDLTVKVIDVAVRKVVPLVIAAL
jgi:hypothetical protein